MKRKSALFFILAVAIPSMISLSAGLWLIVDFFREYDRLTTLHTNREHLMLLLQNAPIRLTAAGLLVALGISSIIIAQLLNINSTSQIQQEVEDLRQKNEAAEELTRKLEQLAHHQRLETLGTLTSSIAHEFNNLLTPIMGYSMMALEQLPPEDALFDDILEIYNASQKAKTIISRMSDLARKNTATAFRPVSPDQLVKKILAIVTPSCPPNVELVLNLGCGEQQFTANEIQITQLLLNLILNGFQAMEETGGTLTVETAFLEDHLHIRIRDTGCGIPEALREQIFNPFFTTKEAGKGTGLGLAIVAQVVEDHRGEITVESAPGEGSCFSIRLPASVFSEE